MKVSGLTKVLAPVAIFAMSSVASANTPNPREVYIQDINYNGSGCPLGTVAENVSPDAKAFTLTFSDYIAEAGPGVSIRDGRRNCQVTLSLKVPQGWQYSVGTFDYRGYVFLDRGMRASHNTSYYFQGQGNTGRFASQMSGEIDRDYTFSDSIELGSLVWSSCNASRALNINTAINVRNTNKRRYPDAEGLITNDSIDGEIKHVFGIRWRRC